MTEGVFALFGVAVGGFCTMLGEWLRDKRSYKRNWQEKRLETLRQVLRLFDRMILFSDTVDRPIYQLEKDNVNADAEWIEICKLRREIVPDIEIFFDTEVKAAFEDIFDNIYHSGHTVTVAGEPTGYQNIVDEVNAFANSVRSKYFIKD